MKLLFDQNLSFKLCALLADLFPGSKSVRELGLERSDVEPHCNAQENLELPRVRRFY
jgi:predicted nuclease of predicted toxin-antitoxin system